MEAIPGPIDRLLVVAPGLWSGAAIGLDEAGPAEVEAGGMLAAAFFSAACRIWSLDVQRRHIEDDKFDPLEQIQACTADDPFDTILVPCS